MAVSSTVQQFSITYQKITRGIPGQTSLGGTCFFVRENYQWKGKLSFADQPIIFYNMQEKIICN